jgi:phage tail sheath protein FI
MLMQSLTQFNTVYGARQSYSVLSDAVETFFREGGQNVYIGRVVGPGATSGFLNLNDAGAAISLVATAFGPGAWSNQYKVGVVAGGASGSFQIQVTDINNVVLEQSSDLLTQGAAVSWSQYSNYIRITLGASANNPANVAPAAMSAGNDQRATITDNEWAVALALFSPSLGPGQVSEPGRTSSVAHNQLKTHAEANNRVYLADLPDSPTQATLLSSAADSVSRMGAAFSPWVIIPGVTVGTVRAIPPCAYIAGMIAGNDPAYGANMPAAGNLGQASFVTDLTQPDFTDAVRTALNAGSVNIIRRLYGGIRNYGWRSLTNAASDPSWVDFGNARLFIDLAAELNLVGENFMFDMIDGQNGSTINAFDDALVGQLMLHYSAGEFFGDTPAQAFAVDTGPDVNTLSTIANNELHAVCRVKMAPFAEAVIIQIVKRQITQTL